MSFTCTRLSIDEYDGVKAVDRAIDLQDDGLKNFFLCRLLGKNFPELYDFIFSFDTFHTNEFTGCKVARFLSLIL